MNLDLSKEHAGAAVDIDALLQDTYLLVVELHQGASVSRSLALRQRCLEQVEQVRCQLKLAGLSPRSINHISHAQCALLDETVLSCTRGDVHAAWASEPLQAEFFKRHQAGEFLYEEVREVLREPAPDLHVLTAFQRILMLGFRGRYRDLNDPEREQLVVALGAQTRPLKVTQRLTMPVGRRELLADLAWLRSPLVHVLAVSLLLVVTWCGMDYLLSGAIASLLPDEG